MHNQGLCTNCRHEVTCKYKKHTATTIYHCEEHELAESISPSVTIKTSADIADFKRNLKGLCSTCDLWDHCSLFSENAIILNCEHYQ